MEIEQELHPGDHADLAESLNGVALCLHSLGRADEALPKYEAALEMFRRLFDGDHPDMATSLGNAGACLESLGQSAEALLKHEAALEMRQRIFKGDHPDVASSHNNVADCLESLGRSTEALSEYEAALENYLVVIANHPRSRFASSSFVPLARCYFVLERFSEAEQQLLQVISGQRFLEPDALEFRDALLEISNLYHDTNRFTEAIEHLNEMMQRYPEDDKLKTVMYMLADSYRGNAIQISRQLEDTARIPPSERRRLEDMRGAHFQMAITHYTKLCDAFEQVDQKRLNRLERDMLRRSYLYRGDCAFQTGEYELAIQLYDYSVRKYSVHHSSMYALVQIVNSYNELGMKDRAQTAHRRALVRLKQLPDEAFSAPDSLMDREAWERWLENSPVAPEKTASALPVGS